MDSNPRRGRPPLADITQLRAEAMQVVLRNGYAEVSMREIADEVGLSLRTLHRYFPGKADIVWGDVDSSFDALRIALGSAGSDVSIIEAVSAVVVEALGPLDEAPGLERDRIRVIATTPELRFVRSPSFMRWREELDAFVARRLGEDPPGLVAVSAGAALQAVIMQALEWWAVHPESTTPGDAVAQALHGLTIVAEG